MRIIGIDGYEVIVRIAKDEYPKLVKAFANLDDDGSEDDS